MEASLAQFGVSVVCCLLLGQQSLTTPFGLEVVLSLGLTV